MNLTDAIAAQDISGKLARRGRVVLVLHALNVALAVLAPAAFGWWGWTRPPEVLPEQSLLIAQQEHLLDASLMASLGMLLAMFVIQGIVRPLILRMEYLLVEGSDAVAMFGRGVNLLELHRVRRIYEAKWRIVIDAPEEAKRLGCIVILRRLGR